MIFSKPKGVATTDNSNSSADVVFVADTNVSDGNSTEVLADENVSDGNSTGIGLGNSFNTFNTKPEEEIIFESQDSEDSALAALHYHDFLTCRCTRCRRSSLRQVTAIIVLSRWCPAWRHHQASHYVDIGSTSVKHLVRVN